MYLYSKPANLQKYIGRELSAIERDISRAEVIRQIIEDGNNMAEKALRVMSYAYKELKKVPADSNEALDEETLEDGTTREVMRFSPYLAPYKVSILPLIKKNHSDKAKEVYKELSKYFMCTYDESGNIGKRYRREDVIGTPWCITIDDDTLNNNTVTVRDRDTMKQVTIKVDEIKDYVEEKIKF